MSLPVVKMRIRLVVPIQLPGAGNPWTNKILTDSDHCDVMSSGVRIKYDDGSRRQIFNTNIACIDYEAPNAEQENASQTKDA